MKTRWSEKTEYLPTADVAACSHCGSACKERSHIPDALPLHTSTHWTCGSWLVEYDDGQNQAMQSDRCRIKQLEQRVAVLEASADPMLTRIKALPREALEEIAHYAVGALWGMSADGRKIYAYDLDKDVSGSDFIDHMSGVLDRHGLTPPDEPEPAGG